MITVFFYIKYKTIYPVLQQFFQIVRQFTHFFALEFYFCHAAMPFASCGNKAESREQAEHVLDKSRQNAS